jgi:mono/diheme cytochrome c family protein
MAIGDQNIGFGSRRALSLELRRAAQQKKCQNGNLLGMTLVTPDRTHEPYPFFAREAVCGGMAVVATVRARVPRTPLTAIPNCYQLGFPAPGVAMRRKFVFAMLLALAAEGAEARTSIWDGVYTEAQADRGHTLYMQNCSRCHGADLSGTFEIPPLVGRFMPYWSGSTLDQLFDYVSTAMPLDHPGSLGPGANADILAFILKSNGIPAGSKELAAGGLKAINFDPAKPGSKRAGK